MLLTGPGGTGKSHVVKAVHKVMEHYRAGHTIRFLAPTGSAASLIDGMTVHKGLGIKVKSTDKGKGNRKLADNQEDYSIVITTQNKTKLRDEWRLVPPVRSQKASEIKDRGPGPQKTGNKYIKMRHIPAKSGLGV